MADASKSEGVVSVGCCKSSSGEGHNQSEYIELDESAAEFAVEETNVKGVQA